MPKEIEPTKRSLREIPQVDFSKTKRLPRGKYAEKARRSFAVAIVEPELFAGSSEAVNAALRAVVDATDAVKHPTKAKRSSRGSKRTAALRAHAAGQPVGKRLEMHGMSVAVLVPSSRLWRRSLPPRPLMRAAMRPRGLASALAVRTKTFV